MIRRDVIIPKLEYGLLLKKAFLYDLVYTFNKVNGYTPDTYLVDFGDTEIATNGDTTEDDLADAVEEN